jgi:comEA protein
MSDFSTATTTRGALDPTKRVNYSLGLVLGVDEFDQEQTYLMARDHLHQRGLHGYGTVCGLQVSIGEDSPPEVLVSPGMAVNPNGQTIRVPLAQCAKLNDWLDNNETAVSDHLAEDNTLSLYVVLCYRECETDLVPVPGGPCRLQEDSMAASRIADDFELSFRFADDLPQQVEEEVVRRFGALLQRIEITHESADYTNANELADLVRALAEEPEAEPDTSPLYLDADESCAILHDAFRVWVTEVRPTLLADGRNCAGGEPDESCVILSRLDMSLTEGGEVDGDVTVAEEERPVLLHSRLLQEWLLCGNGGGQSELSRTFATLSAPNETTVRAWLHVPRPLSQPAASAINVRVNETAVSLSSITQPVADVNVFDLTLDGVALSNDDRVVVRFDLTDMSVAGDSESSLAEIADDLDYTFLDRRQNAVTAFLVVVGIPRLDDLADVSAAEPNNGDIIVWDNAAGEWVNQRHRHSLNDLTTVNAPSPNGGDLLRFDETSRRWIPDTLNLDDLNDVSAPKPDKGQVLTWQTDGDAEEGSWQPADPPSGGTGPHNHALNDLSDVTATSPGKGQVLTWNGSAWVPDTSTATGGDFVVAQAGYYEIVGAGIFGVEGEPIAKPYNELEAIFQNEGQYLLSFPNYRPPEEGFTYIVKGTIMEPDLPELIDFDPFDPGHPATSPAIFQVVRFLDKGILIWITQPTLSGSLISAALQGQIEAKEFENLLRFRPVMRQFMVEISYYESKGEGGSTRRININTATEEELRGVPRIGPTLATNIVADREKNGDFSSVDDLTRVTGIGTSSIEDVRPFLTVSGR